jgi:hypothetical protein
MGALKAHCCAEVRAATKAGPMVGQMPAKTADQMDVLMATLLGYSMAAKTADSMARRRLMAP